VGRGLSGIAPATGIVAEPGADDDRQLVAAVRRGDDRAFEALYARYHRRIHAYVLGMVKDHGRAEDVTQEVFVSAVRRMRETERPIAFKPWIYEIAKNACIDQFRRSRRAEEVSLEADEGLAPSDYGRLVGSDPMPDDAVAAKQELDNLCGAFGGLSDTHHEILLLRELEGLSYREIGDRMGMSRPAVESTLFRARRRLTEEYDELRSGERCLRIQGLIAMAGSTRLGTREQRRLSRHVAYCQPCRREALAAGLDSAILTHVPLRKRAAKKIAGLLPFPIFGRRFGGGAGADGAGGSLASGPGWMAHAPMLSEQLSGGWGKLATVAAVLVAGVGAAGVGTKVAGGPDQADSPKRAAAQPASASTSASTPSGISTTGTKAKSVARAERGTQRGKAKRRSARSRNGGGSGSSAPTAGSPAAAGGSGGGGSTSGSSGSGDSASPAVNLPTSSGEPVKKAVDDVGQTVQPAVDQVGQTVQPVVDGVGQTVAPVVSGAAGATAPITGPVNEVVDGVEETTGLPLPPLP
jgi:RNA polymerase sigma factor (sigma-70 family)